MNSNDHRKIILTRHGQTEWNQEYRFQGRTNTKLTHEGEEQARKLSQRLLQWPPEILYTSPLTRALVTAEIIGENFGLTPVIIPELEEIDFGTWEGQSISGLKTSQSETFAKWRADPFFNPPPGAETWEQLQKRLTKAVNIFLSTSYKRIVVVSHGGIVRALYAVFMGLDPHYTWNIDVSNCSLTGVEMRHGRACLSFANDDLHIRGGEQGLSLPIWGESYGS